MSTGGRRTRRVAVSLNRRVVTRTIPPRACIFPVIYRHPSIVRRCHAPPASGLLSPQLGQRRQRDQEKRAERQDTPLKLGVTAARSTGGCLQGWQDLNRGQSKLICRGSSAAARGVVTTCCYVARLYGVRSAMPMFKALKACPDAVVIPPDMAKYRIVGRQVRALMRETTPLVEAVSIDEALLELSR